MLLLCVCIRRTEETLADIIQVSRISRRSMSHLWLLLQSASGAPIERKRTLFSSYNDEFPSLFCHRQNRGWTRLGIPVCFTITGYIFLNTMAFSHPSITNFLIVLQLKRHSLALVVQVYTLVSWLPMLQKVTYLVAVLDRKGKRKGGKSGKDEKSDDSGTNNNNNSSSSSISMNTEGDSNASTNAAAAGLVKREPAQQQNQSQAAFTAVVGKGEPGVQSESGSDYPMRDAESAMPFGPSVFVRTYYLLQSVSQSLTV
jgi:hypothetical protein